MLRDSSNFLNFSREEFHFFPRFSQGIKNQEKCNVYPRIDHGAGEFVCSLLITTFLSSLDFRRITLTLVPFVEFFLKYFSFYCILNFQLSFQKNLIFVCLHSFSCRDNFRGGVSE